MLRSLLLFSLLCFVVSDYAPSSCAQTDFLQLLAKPSWPPRQEAGVTRLTAPFTFTQRAGQPDVTWPAGTIAIMGGGADYNDVWASSDNGNSWSLVSGVAYWRNSAHMDAIMPDGQTTAMCSSRDGATSYIVGGVFAGAKSQRVAKGDLKRWSVITTVNPWIARERTQCLVDKDNNVFIFGGNTITQSRAANDVWMAQQGAAPWQRITNTASWPARDSHLVAWLSTNDTNMAPSGEIMIIAGGTYVSSSSYKLNDVWASADKGVSWYLLTADAPWERRSDANMASYNNVLVVTGGDCGSECNLNDVWASLDGGWTWGLCGGATHAGYDNREDHNTIFDKDGHLLIMAGAQTWPTKGNAQDVWRSRISFNNHSAVAEACGLTMPFCGVGLTCLPQQYCPCDPSQPSISQGGIKMEKIGLAPWATGRQEAGLAYRPTPLTFIDGKTQQQMTFQKSLIFFGGKLSNTYYNDVWASGDDGVTWNMISGTYNGTTVGSSPYRDNSRSADCRDKDGRMYMIAGTNNSVMVTTVWASDDGISWQLVTDIAPFPPREAAMCITDHLKNVYLFGGNVPVYSRANDVWKSANGGRDWTLQTFAAPWPARGQHDATAYYSATLERTIIYSMNGYYSSPSTSRNNDIWASSDQGVTWIKIGNGAYRGRQDSETDNYNGIMVLSGGDIGTDTPGNTNDIWASLDGGYVWGRCNVSAGYTPREDQSTVFDSQGRLVLVGGDAPWIPTALQIDTRMVYRSNGSFSDPNWVARSCGLTIPSCGIGLQCWPTTQSCRLNCPGEPFRFSSSGSSQPDQPIDGGSDSKKTSVGLTVGMAFLGLAIGLIFAVCLAFWLISRSGRGAINKPVSMEPSESELSRVDTRS